MADPTQQSRRIDNIKVGSTNYAIALSNSSINPSAFTNNNGVLDVKKDATLTVGTEGLGIKLSSGLTIGDYGVKVNADENYLKVNSDNKLTINSNNFATINGKSILNGGNIDVSVNGSLTDLQNQINTINSNKANKSTTLAGYGIADARIENDVITLGTASITPLTSIPAEYVTETELNNKLNNYYDVTASTNNFASKSTVDTINNKYISGVSINGSALTVNNKVASITGIAKTSDITALTNRINTLVSGNTSEAIDNFNEIIKFLENTKNTQNLVDLLDSKLDKSSISSDNADNTGIVLSNNKVKIAVGENKSGLKLQESRILLNIDTSTNGSSSGFTFDSNEKLAVWVGNGLSYTSKGQIQVKLGNGLGMTADGEIQYTGKTASVSGTTLVM